jgi:hypothetical protein
VLAPHDVDVIVTDVPLLVYLLVVVRFSFSVPRNDRNGRELVLGKMADIVNFPFYLAERWL